jgi:hypothetical protein
MTEEQKLRRAEIARQNGRKSRGPVSPEGKSRSSMNAIATGQHLEVHKEIFPECMVLLGTDDREAYVRLWQKHLKQYKPHSEQEQVILRQMTAELFQFQRLSEAETFSMQALQDEVLREHPSIEWTAQLVQAYSRAATEEKTHRFIERKKKAHMTAYNALQRNLIQLRKNFPMQPPEPIDITADNKVAETDVPTPAVVEELLGLADRAKNEPAFVPPAYVLNLLEDNEVMQKIAPDYEVDELLIRFGRRKPPIAA